MELDVPRNGCQFLFLVPYGTLLHITQRALKHKNCALRRQKEHSLRKVAKIENEESALKIAEMNWMQVEGRTAQDDRCIFPIGSVEQHAYLSLATDMILAEKVA